MTTFLSKEVQVGLDNARIAALASGSRLRIKADGKTYAILRMWKTGFSMARASAPSLRGFVDLYDGSIHLFQCLVVASDEAAEEMQFEFKRLTHVSYTPPLDFERNTQAPVALIENYQ